MVTAYPPRWQPTPKSECKEYGNGPNSNEDRGPETNLAMKFVDAELPEELKNRDLCQAKAWDVEKVRCVESLDDRVIISNLVLTTAVEGIDLGHSAQLIRP